MRIVVSGTHASGKSTLISDFALRHQEFSVLPDPFELVDEAWDTPGAGIFATQLRIAAERLTSSEFGPNFIAERGPLDFLAYFLALEEWSGTRVSPDLIERSIEITAEALSHVDLLVVLPVTSVDPIRVPAEEHPELRAGMNEILLELIEDPDLVGSQTRVAEIVGGREERVDALEALVSAENDRGRPPHSSTAHGL